MLDKFDVETYKNQPEIIRQTLQQVQKDFGMFGFEVLFSGNAEADYKEMLVQLSDYVAVFMENDCHQFTALLYHIDVGEGKIEQALEQNSEQSMADVIAELVMHRELKKVLTRNYFKQEGMQV